MKLIYLIQRKQSLSSLLFSEVGQLRVNNKVKYHLSMKLSHMFDPYPLHTSDKIVVKHISVKETLSKLDHEPKCQGLSKNKKIINLKHKHATPKKQGPQG